MSTNGEQFARSMMQPRDIVHRQHRPGADQNAFRRALHGDRESLQRAFRQFLTGWLARDPPQREAGGD